MLNPTREDLKVLKKNMVFEDSFESINQYKGIYLILRWFKVFNLYLHLKYWWRRFKMASQSDDMQKYYKIADYSYNKIKLDYLKIRKSWFVVPLNWDKFADKSCKKILDVGCGDGDTIQRVIEFIEKEWRNRTKIHDLEIVGIDLNKSRINIAQKYCRSKYKQIKLKFEVLDAVKKINYPTNYFDYAILTGVLEILNDKAAMLLAKNIGKVVKKGIYIEDLADKYPGGFPRNNIEKLYSNKGFKLIKRYYQLTEPFSLSKIPDPCWKDMGWPILKDQVLWLERRGNG